jgi:hypothetical protein
MEEDLLAACRRLIQDGLSRSVPRTLDGGA